MGKTKQNSYFKYLVALGSRMTDRYKSRQLSRTASRNVSRDASPQKRCVTAQIRPQWRADWTRLYSLWLADDWLITPPRKSSSPRIRIVKLALQMSQTTTTTTAIISRCFLNFQLWKRLQFKLTLSLTIVSKLRARKKQLFAKRIDKITANKVYRK